MEQVGIPNSLHRLLQDVLGCASAIILIIFLSKVKIFPLLEELPKNIIPHFMTERKYAQKLI